MPIKSLLAKFKSQSRKRKVIIVILALFVGLFGFWQVRQRTKAPDYELKAAVLGSVTEIVSETGNVTTAGSTSIYSTTTGIVEDVFVNNGDIVAKGDVLFKVVATATQQEKDAALSAYLTANSALETAKATQYSLQADMFTDWDSFLVIAQSDTYENEDGSPRHEQRSAAEFHIPEKDWLASEVLYKKQAGVITQAQANVSAKWEAYQETQDSEVVAILSGEIKNLSVAKGDKVTVPTALTLASTTPVVALVHENVHTTIKLAIGETDAIKIREGQVATVEIDAIPNKTFSGYVDRIDTLATPADRVVTYAAYIALEESSEMIRGGLTADVDIVVAKEENILVVPSSAVKPYEGSRAVRIVGNKGEIEFIPVGVGIRGDGVTQILSGIDEGTQVIVALKNEQVERQGGLF